MSSPYIGEIRMFGGNFAPAGWAFCNGSLLPISENEALFQLIGTTYGGDGQSTFALPDLRGRIPLGSGQGSSLPNFTIGQAAGSETATLSTAQIPLHAHYVNADGSGSNTASIVNAMPAAAGTGSSPAIYLTTASIPNGMAANAVGSNAGGQPISLFQPYLCVNFILSLFGIFPQHP